MIKIFHKYMKSFGLTLISFLIAFTMLGFGVDFYNGRGRDFVARVDGEDISRQELNQLQEEINDRYKAQFGDYFAQAADMLKLDPAKQAREMLIPVFLVNRAASDIGFVYGGESLKMQLARMFPGENGDINRSAYAAFLRQKGQPAEYFEANLKKKGAVAQMEEVINDLSLASKAEAVNLLEEEELEYSADYLEFNPEDFVKKVEEPKEDALKKYYEDNAVNYQKEAQVSYEYVTFIPEAMLDIVEVSPEDIEIYYSENEGNFTTQDTAKVQMIRIPIPEEKEKDVTKTEQNSSEPSVKDNTKAEADKVQKSVAAGEDFLKLAKQYADKEEKNAGQEIEIRRDDRNYHPAIMSEIFKKAAAGILDVIETEDAFYIVKINEFTVGGLKPLDEVKDEIITAIKKDSAPAWVNEKANALYEEWAKGTMELKDFAAENNLVLAKSDGLLTKGQNPKGVTFDLTTNVLSNWDGQNKKILVDTGKVLALVQVDEYKDAYLPDFAEIVERVKSDYIKQQSEVLAFEAAKEVANAFAEKKFTDMSAAAKEFGGERKEEKNMKINALPGIFANDSVQAELSKIHKAGLASKSAYKVDNKYYVFLVTDIKRIDTSKIEEAKLNEYLAKASARNADELMRLLIKEMKLNSEIEERM